MDKIKKWLTNRWVLLVMAILLVLFNLIDGGISFWAIYIARFAYEANPIMAAVMGVSPYLFLAFKVVVPTICVTLLYKHRHHPVANGGLIVAFLVYLGLMVHFGLLLHTAFVVGLF